MKGCRLTDLRILRSLNFVYLTLGKESIFTSLCNYFSSETIQGTLVNITLILHFSVYFENTLLFPVISHICVILMLMLHTHVKFITL